MVYGLDGVSCAAASLVAETPVAGSVPGGTASTASLAGTSLRSRRDSFITFSWSIITAWMSISGRGGGRPRAGGGGGGGGRGGGQPSGGRGRPAGPRGPKGGFGAPGPRGNQN